MNFYDLEIAPIQNEIMSYIDSRRFNEILEIYQSKYFLDEYLECLKKYCKGGKCIRAYLVGLGYRISSHIENKIDIESAIAYELFEAGILAHDDIIDRSPVRRSIPSMYVALGNDHLGLSRGICVGDIGILMSNAFIENSSFPESIRLKAIKHQNVIFSHTISGELLDIDLSNSKIYSENDVIEMYKLKTSLYTIAGPLMLGAILADSSSQNLNFLHEFGINLGIAFQIKDDIIGIFGDEDKIGKSITSDVEEGKKSILTAYFDRNSTASIKKEFYSIYGNPNIKKSDMDLIRKYLIESNALNYANEQIQNYSNNALSIIESYDISEEKKQLLRGFCSYITQREK